jgi:hypothetical protein
MSLKDTDKTGSLSGSWPPKVTMIGWFMTPWRGSRLTTRAMGGWFTCVILKAATVGVETA